ncbi:hypothetical protein HMPREF1624_04788 [Sporothrix schenckii ATCC 58251]|uniref:Uncharacterized protein n=1 Tax=Sporothrix schenckii (strain ATCC 58251 / de Perez 2211183) TaxID=1391915 RepID=U7PVA7_SPOS1|nr:hypothetical protein HMPREF1624_04788 [Sporothrix schenckii ATCC 58251]
MADYNHRRAASELLAYRQVSGGAVYGQDRFSVSQRPGSAGTLFAHPTPRGHHMVDQNGSKYANTNFHYRSQSYESPCGWDASGGGADTARSPGAPKLTEARKRKQHKLSDIKLHSSYGSSVNLVSLNHTRSYVTDITKQLSFASVAPGKHAIKGQLGNPGAASFPIQGAASNFCTRQNGPSPRLFALRAKGLPEYRHRVFGSRGG